MCVCVYVLTTGIRLSRSLALRSSLSRRRSTSPTTAGSQLLGIKGRWHRTVDIRYGGGFSRAGCRTCRRSFAGIHGVGAGARQWVILEMRDLRRVCSLALETIAELATPAAVDGTTTTDFWEPGSTGCRQQQRTITRVYIVMARSAASSRADVGGQPWRLRHG